MRYRSFYASGLLVLGILTLTGRTAAAQTTAVGPYYATPSWDQTFACTTPASCPRFIVLSNFDGEAVLDRETGLVWERSPRTSSRDWLFATIGCIVLEVGDRFGWRLPTIQELKSLIDPTTDFLPAGHPFSDVQRSQNYWSATVLEGSDLVFAMNIRRSGLDLAEKTDSFLTWCVRGGQGVGAQ